MNTPSYTTQNSLLLNNLIQFYNNCLSKYILDKNKKDLGTLTDFKPEKLPDQFYRSI